MSSLNNQPLRLLHDKAAAKVHRKRFSHFNVVQQCCHQLIEFVRICFHCIHICSFEVRSLAEAVNQWAYSTLSIREETVSWDLTVWQKPVVCRMYWRVLKSYPADRTLWMYRPSKLYQRNSACRFSFVVKITKDFPLFPHKAHTPCSVWTERHRS